VISSLSIGATIRDTYTVLEKLGEGAFSEVYLARHKYLGLQAIKIFKANSPNPTSDQFREAFLLSRIAHPNIIRIFEANRITDSGPARSYVTMEYAAGGTLYSYLQANAPLPIERAIEFGQQICGGLAAAHSQKPPIIHRDIKPQNIVVTTNESEIVLKLADFGLAKNIDPKLRMVSAAGTLLYMPPEGFHNYETPASDVYSAGIILYEMLTGRFPFEPVDFTDEQQFRLGLAKTRSKVPEPPSAFAKNVQPWLDEVCLRALQPDIRKRFPSAVEFLGSLDITTKSSGAQNQAAPSKDTRESSLQKVRDAVSLSGQYAELPRAISLMEQALAENEELRHKYGSILEKWKSGVVL
jgi:eukaryotic-like serine/threonine-protein kinase